MEDTNIEAPELGVGAFVGGGVEPAVGAVVSGCKNSRIIDPNSSAFTSVSFMVFVPFVWAS